MTSSPPIGKAPSRPLFPLLSLCDGAVLGGRYRIESLAPGAKTGGVHFSATDLTTGARVSANVLVAPGASSTYEEERHSARLAFLAGARRAKALEGPHVARVLDTGVTSEGHPWIVREHLGSETLAAHLRQHGALATSDAVDITLAVCDALAEAHAKDILHLSLGPHAVHVAWSGPGLSEVKVTGLGTAAAESALSLGCAGEVECILRAPEQIRNGSAVDARADVWAIAVLLHTMIAGASPFAPDTPSGASLSVIIDEPPSLAGVPDELSELVDRALSTDPARRPSSVLDFAEALVAFSTNPAAAQDRITKARAEFEEVEELLEDLEELLLPAESAPTLVVEEFDYEALVREQKQAKAPPPAPRPSVPLSAPRSVEVLFDVAPSVRELLPSEPPPPVIASIAPLARRETPTRIIRRVDTSFARRRVIKILGLAAAAACVALIVLLGTEGSRLSRQASQLGATPASAPAPTQAQTSTSTPAAAELAAAAPAEPPVAPVADLPAAMPTTTHPAEARPADPPRAAVGGGAAKPPRTNVAPAPSTSSAPASKPSPSGQADDLRRFLDDRR